VPQIYFCMKNVSHRSGFSLVELLVVVAIVTLLAALILPGMARAREYAYFTKCKSSLRQVGLGLLVFAADHKGRLPDIGKPCSPGQGLGAKGRIGTWPTLTYKTDYGTEWCNTMYDDWMIQNSGGYWCGQDWKGNLSTGYRGRPRQPGKYLPVELMYDPICAVRNWCYNFADVYTDSKNPTYAETEEARDRAFRGRTRASGYAFFVGEVGCAQQLPDHIAGNYGGTGDNIGNEEPFRWATKSRNLRSLHSPTAWMAACYPAGDTKFGISPWGGWRRQWFSHFGARKAQIGIFKFNVLHLDGHVDDSIWKSATSATNNWYPYLVPSGEWPYPYGYSHYGWPYHGCYREPDFEGAFDENL